MFDEITILGGGKIGSGFALKASKLFPQVKFYLITRDKSKFLNSELSQIKNVNILDYNDNIKQGGICFYCISVDESKIIQEVLTDNVSISRSIILKQNLHLAQEMLSLLKNIQPSKLFIITNPVELISNFLKNKLDNVEVYGLGLELDKKRIKEIFSMFLNLDLVEDLFILGNHSFLPVPILSNTLFFQDCKRITLFQIFQNLKSKKNYRYLNTEIDYYKEFYNYIKKEYLDISLYDFLPINRIYDIVNFFINLLVRSEFNNNRPPIDNPVDSMLETLHTILIQNKFINISYYSDNGVFEGGIFKISNGNFLNIKIKYSELESSIINKSNMKLYSQCVNCLF